MFTLIALDIAHGNSTSVSRYFSFNITITMCDEHTEIIE